MCVESLKNCGSRIADRGLGSGSGSSIRIPNSEIRNRLRRSALRLGISLTEVLIALGILTIGLLGVASVFPVGSWYMQKAAIADQGSAIAQSVMNEAVTRGLLNPSSWYVMVPAPPSPPALGKWCTNFQSDGKFCEWAPPSLSFARPFATALSEAISQPGAASDPSILNMQFGSAYVIDPIGVAALAMSNGQVTFSNGFASLFPSSMRQFGTTTLYGNAWQPWFGSSPSASGPSPTNTWPIRRVTLQQANGWQMSPALANYTCGGTDDLSVELPKRDDRPAAQNWDLYRDSPMARQWAGDFSWMLTVLPTTNAARNGMASNPEGFDYQVSAVVFHKRTLPTSFPGSNIEASRNSAMERGVRAKVLTTSPNGGELLLEKLSSTDDSTESPFSQLKTGNWIMLCGPHPNSSDSNPKFVLNWYQVLSIDKETGGIDPNTQRVVALRGTQWPWQPATSITTNDLSNNLCVAICKGVVAVHTKTIRLENPKGGSFGSGSSLTTQPGKTDPNMGLF